MPTVTVSYRCFTLKAPAQPLTTTHVFTIATALSFPDFTWREQNCCCPSPHGACSLCLRFPISSFSGQLFPARDRGVPQRGRMHERLQPPQRHPAPRYLLKGRPGGQRGSAHPPCARGKPGITHGDLQPGVSSPTRLLLTVNIFGGLW